MKEKYGGKSSKMERGILKDKEMTESKKHIGFNGGNEVERNKTSEPGKDLK